jgi:serine protease AprX
MEACHTNMGSATSLLADQRQTAVINLISSPPGEGINGPIPLINDVEADYKSYDGMSQAAAHVSGAAAMILARYPGMRGDPRAVKKALCESTSDLGRERYFQGAGLVDIIRALQSL